MGAGPVGLAVAGELVRHGVSTRIVEQKPSEGLQAEALMSYLTHFFQPEHAAAAH